MAKLDTELQLLLARKSFYEKNPSKGKLEMGADEPIHIAIKFHGDLSAIIQSGFRSATRPSATIAYGITTITDLEKLANHPQIESIQQLRRKQKDLSSSVPDIKANEVWTRSGSNFTGYTGKDIIVGIIDTGIDFRHHTFRKSDSNGSTRILKIWDQTLTVQGDEEAPDAITNSSIALDPTPLGYGVEYSQASIDNTLQKEAAGETPVTPVRHKDTDGHGTHVAGIAAGDGSQSGSCHGGFHYIGVAPDADIIAVRLWGLTDGDENAPTSPNDYMIDAIRYIINEAREIGKPVVINLSLGRFSDDLDGSSPTCQDVDNLLTNNSTGTAIVFTAGNNANDHLRADATVPGNTTDTIDLEVYVRADDDKTRSFSILYSGSNLEVKIDSPVEGTDGIIDWVSNGDSDTSATANGGGEVFVNNTTDRISISITPPTDGKNKSGVWHIQLRNTNTTATPVKAFCLRTTGNYAYFNNHVTTETTLGEYATCFQPVTVGSYKVGDGLSSFSSRGPTLDTRTLQKPDICAPGDGIVSAGILSDRREFGDYFFCKVCCCACCEDYYVNKSGTSMAAPHVAGVIALMLHKNPNLTHTQIKTFIRDNASAVPSGETAEELKGWGEGKINAKDILDQITEVTPPVAPPTPLVVPHPDHFTMVQERFLATQRGQEFLRLFNKYFHEIRLLINTNKKVATVWHRIKGPVWVRLGIKASTTPDTPMPLEIEGYHLFDGIQQMLPVLKRFSSNEFIEDINKYQEELALIRDGMSLNEVIEAIGNKQVISYKL